MTFEDIFIYDKGEPVSKICFGGELSGVGAEVRKMSPGSVFVITDVNVRKYATEVAEAIAGDACHPVRSIIGINISEQGKTMDTVMHLSAELLEKDADREAILIAVGGGITTDIVGFTASIYKRGVRFAFVPTTVLAQTDASIGGKTGVNFLTYKNILGVISQPAFTYICHRTLSTLSTRDFLSGAAELVKTFIIEDSGHYSSAISLLSGMKVGRSRQSALLDSEFSRGSEVPELTDISEQSDESELLELLHGAAKIKAGIVSRDQFEKGERRKLNLGHTFAHAIESLAARTGYDVTHGEAVAAGIVMAAELSEACGYADKGLAERIKCDFVIAGLNVSVPFSIKELSEAMKKDKKAEAGIVHFVLIEKIGKTVIVDMSVAKMLNAMKCTT